MNYGQVKDRALQLIRQYTVAGAVYAPSYNNQQDYLNNIPGLVNDAMMEIATTVRRIPTVMALPADSGYTEFGDWAKYELPEDFYQFKTGDTFITTEEGHTFHTNLYSIQGRKFLLVPKRELEKGRVYTITYYRYPMRLPDKPTDAMTLDNVPETHEAIAYYVAAFLVMDDNSFDYAALYNKYEDKLAKMAPDISAEVHPVADGYAFFDSWTYWT